MGGQTKRFGALGQESSGPNQGFVRVPIAVFVGFVQGSRLPRCLTLGLVSIFEGTPSFCILAGNQQRKNIFLGVPQKGAPMWVRLFCEGEVLNEAARNTAIFLRGVPQKKDTPIYASGLAPPATKLVHSKLDKNLQVPGPLN